MALKRERWPAPDIELALRNLKSTDDEARRDGVRGLCPCHAGWDAFEGHVREVLRSLRDPSRAVRANAIHVLEDAARMRHDSEFDYELQEAAEKVRRKRASRFRPQESSLETSHRKKIKGLKRPY
jgi:hypothetical protein